MRLYHFVKEQYGLLDLQHRRLKIARINDLNDPFEFFPACPDRKGRDMIRDFKQRAHDAIGLLCFSKDRKNPVLWSHYAEGHKGMCFGFDIPKEHVREVRYISTRPIVDMERLFTNMESGHAEIQRWLNVKFEHWAYEQEWRAELLLDPSEQDVDGNWYQPFSPDLRLREVLIGEGSRVTRLDLQNLLGDLAPDVKLWRTRLAFKPIYEVVLQQDRSRW
ncbi:MAG TPA: DUF2971 domain-containing protein [Allosphingosinicella sp.]|nr:DUF2971 domain-containing protein [Allosphingosinicella sp.]